MSTVPNWIQPLAVAIEKIGSSRESIISDVDYGLNVLRKALLANNSFDIGNLSESEQRAASRMISTLSDENNFLPRYIFDALRSETNEYIKIHHSMLVSNRSK